MSRVSNLRRRNKKTGKRRIRKQGRLQIYGSAYSQLKSDIARIMRIINVEDKYIDVSASGTALTGSWQLVLLNGITTGTSSVTRNGQSIKMLRMEFRYNLAINILSTNPQTARVVVFKDRQSNASAPTATDVFPASSVSSRVVGYLDRFQILYDETITLSPNGQEIQVASTILGLNVHEKFNAGTAGTIADITENSLYLMFYSDNGSNFPSITYYSRIYFVDN